MSGHIKGRLAVKSCWLIPEDHFFRPIGGSVDKDHDRNHYANIVATVSEKYHDQSANVRRLAATWNACEGMTTEAIEALTGIGSLCGLKSSELQAANDRIAKLEALVAERDAMLGRRPCQNSRCMELNAAHALLREVIAENYSGHPLRNISGGLADSIRVHLDACDTLEGK